MNRTIVSFVVLNFIITMILLGFMFWAHTNFDNIIEEKVVIYLNSYDITVTE